MLKRILFSAVICLVSVSLYGQNTKIDVNHFTGTAMVTIPLFNVQSGACSVPVGLVYNTNGVKNLDLGMDAGKDWQIDAGGEIRRQLRGLPDDCKKDASNNARLGWIYNTKGTAINNFSIANDNNSGTCTDETADLNYINSNFMDLADTEPDVFVVNAPGLSCKLVFDNNHVLRTTPYMDVKVTYETDTDGAIKSFSITNDKGLKYVFSEAEVSIKTTQGLASNIIYFKNEYNQYKSGIKYNSAWKLTQIYDANANVVQIDYDQIDDLPTYNHPYVLTSVDSVNVIVGAASNNSTRLYQFTKTTTFVPKRILAITYGYNDRISFVYNFLSYQKPVISTINGYGKTVKFGYWGLSALTSFSITAPGVQDRVYKFAYNQSMSDTTRIFPDSSSVQKDYWGYYNKSVTANLKPPIYINPSNPSYERYRFLSPGNVSASYSYQLSGASRNADPIFVQNGTLKQITYPEGGTTTLTYEPNDFYDSTAGIVISGGGVRVKQISSFDGTTTANNMVRNFSYLNPATGLTSGKPISLPTLAFTTPYTGSGTTQDLWNYSTVRLETDLSEQDNTVIYNYVKESRSGAGSILYEFTNPATNWDLTSGTDWVPTTVNIARPTCSSYGFVRNEINTYPFPPNINYEFERGLVKKITNFNDNGQEVSETAYTYTRTGAPFIITGFKCDDNSSVKAYAKYNIYTSSGELVTQEVNKVFDSATLTNAQQTTTKIYYTSLQHKLPTQIERQNSDGSINRTYTNYSKDFNAAVASDSSALAISHLQGANMNIPLEIYYKSERSGVNRTIGAQLVKYNTFNPVGAVGALYLPAQKLSFSDDNGVTDFSPASINAGIFTKDPRYIVNENYRAYDFAGYLFTKDDNNRNVQTVIIDHYTKQPVASVSNAAITEIGYNDFDTQLYECDFKKDNNTYSYSTNSRTGTKSLSLEALATLSRTVKKNVNADNYIFSVWANSTAAGNITLTLTNTSNQASNYTLVLANSIGKWKYYELKVPVTNMSASFTAKFQSNIAVLIDDVLFYPENAEVNTAAYDLGSFLKTAETNTNGVSKYYSYDGFGRLRYAFDQDKQILLKKTYIKDGTSHAVVLNSTLSSNTNGQSILNFNASGSGYSTTEGMTFDWNFGDGTTGITTSAGTTSHTFTKAGTYTVKVTLNSPFYSKKDTTLNVNVQATFPVYYTKNTISGRVTSLQLYQNGLMVYNFSEANLISGSFTVPQGIYDVKIYFTKVGDASFKSIGWLTSDHPDSCFPTSTTSPISFTADLKGTGYLRLVADTPVCLL